MRALLLIPSYTQAKVAGAGSASPTMDYEALKVGLAASGAGSVLLMDYVSVENDHRPIIRLAHRLFGPNAALALAGFLQRNSADCIFSNAENVGIPLALLLKWGRRPGHVMIGHRLSNPRKRSFFTRFMVQSQIDRLLVYSKFQQDYAAASLGFIERDIELIQFQADTEFFRPKPQHEVDYVCSAGLERRDYATLVAAASELPDVQFKIAAASPWSKHTAGIDPNNLPANVQLLNCTYAELRTLYSKAILVVVPLLESDYQAGITTVLEAMSMGKPVALTRTTGMSQTVIDGETGVLAPVGDVQALVETITRLLKDAALRRRLGCSARLWVEREAGLSQWVAAVIEAMEYAARTQG